jgi:nucleoside-diphosphate-sugar epimerase
MKVLVTGGAGYLGCLVVPLLLEQGHEVTIYDKLMWGIQPLLHVATRPELRIVRGDVRDEIALRKVVRGQDAIVNLAAIVGYPACLEYPNEARETNQESVASLSRMLSPSQLCIQASTGSTYGQVDGVCVEDTPINPLTLYGETKAKAEEAVLAHGGVPLRFATVFGVSPRMRLDLLVNEIVYQVAHYGTFVMYEGHSRRTFLHCRDAAASILFAIDNYEQMSGRAFNVGDEKLNYTKRAIADLVMAQHRYYLHAAEFGEDKDKRDYEVSYGRIKQLGYKATVTMEDGIKELLQVTPLIKEKSLLRNI